MLGIAWILIVLGGMWVVSALENLMEKEEEKKRNEEIHRKLVSDIVRSLNDLDSEDTGEE
jgi:hypothetical protein